MMVQTCSGQRFFSTKCDYNDDNGNRGGDTIVFLFKDEERVAVPDWDSTKQIQ